MTVIVALVGVGAVVVGAGVVVVGSAVDDRQHAAQRDCGQDTGDCCPEDGLERARGEHHLFEGGQEMGLGLHLSCNSDKLMLEL